MSSQSTNHSVKRAAVTIAIPTYRRRWMLGTLLTSLERQHKPAHTMLRVVVLDNDPAGNARSMIEPLMNDCALELDYVHVPKAGLAEVRNAALEYAFCHRADFIAMIDDDELPEPQWLSELLRVCESSNADAAVGPVPRSLPADAPLWLREGGFFDDIPMRADGELVVEGHSGNCLLRTQTLQRLGLRFEASLNLAGGEDVLFFRQLIAGGGTIAFAARALATEFIDASRLSAKYVMLRNLRTGNTLALCDKKLKRRFWALSLRFAKGLGRLALGMILLMPKTVLQGFRGAMEALCGSLRGCGMLLGLAGIQVFEYRR